MRLQYMKDTGATYSVVSGKKVMPALSTAVALS